MAEPQGRTDGNGDGGASGSRRRSTASKRALTTQTQDEAMAAGGSLPATPCGACKFLRRKCIGGCIFAPYFGSDQGAAKFAAVHKVFGASNVSKLLSNIPVNRRHEAATTISYEAQARLSDPVYGCVSTILALQQQVASLQAELAMLQTQLMNSKFVYASAFQTTQLQQPNMNVAALQPAYSNNSCASTNLIMNLRNFNDHTPSFDLAMDTTPSSHSVEPLGLTRLSQYEDEDEEESKTQLVFNHR